MEDSQPTRTWPLVAIGLSQLLMLWFIVWLVGHAVSMALNMGGSGDSGGALLVVCMAIVPFVGSALYATYDAGHSRPIIRGFLGIVVYVLTAYVSVVILVPVRESFWAAVPLIAAGAMLAVVLPETDLFWKLVRILAPAVVGIALVMLMSVISEMRDVPFEWWLWTIAASFAIGLGGIRVAEVFRLA